MAGLVGVADDKLELRQRDKALLIAAASLVLGLSLAGRDTVNFPGARHRPVRNTLPAPRRPDRDHDRSQLQQHARRVQRPRGRHSRDIGRRHDLALGGHRERGRRAPWRPPSLRLPGIPGLELVSREDIPRGHGHADVRGRNRGHRAHRAPRNRGRDPVHAGGAGLRPQAHVEESLRAEEGLWKHPGKRRTAPWPPPATLRWCTPS